MNYKILVISLFCTASLSAMSQQPCAIISEIESGGTITIHQPAALDSLLVKTANAAVPESKADAATEESSSRPTRTGYRVQIFEDNNPHTARRQAEAYNARMHSEFPHIRSYISFNSPYWRVKAGDFKSRAEAEAVLSELKQAFPALSAYMRIVRDKINSFD